MTARCADCGRTDTELMPVVRVVPHRHEVTVCAAFIDCLHWRNRSSMPVWRCSFCWAIVPQSHGVCPWCGRDVEAGHRR